MIRVMGLDLKPARSGIAINYDPGTGNRFPQVQCVGKTRTLHEQVRIAERAVLARAQGYRPHVAFVEATFTKGRHSDYGQIAVHFAVTHLRWSLNVPWVDVTTGKVKMWATGSGSQRGKTKVTKDQVIEAVIARYGRHMPIPAGDDDACDAVALMTLAAAAYGQPVDGVQVYDMPREYARAVAGLALPDLNEQGS